MEMSSHKDQSPEILPFCCYKHFFYTFNVVFIHEKAIKAAQNNLSSFHFISYFFAVIFLYSHIENTVYNSAQRTLLFVLSRLKARYKVCTIFMQFERINDLIKKKEV